MGFLHVLLAITLALALIRARTELASKHRRRGGVLVIHVAIALFLGRPTIVMVLAAALTTLPWSAVGLFVFAVASR